MTTMLAPALSGLPSDNAAMLMLQAVFLDVWRVKPSALKRFQSIPVGTLVPLVGRLVSAGHLKISVDQEVLSNVLRLVEQHRDTRRQLRDFVCGGASCELVCRLFPISGKEYRRLRYGLALGGDTVKPRRSRKLPFTEQLAIWHKWQELSPKGRSLDIVAERQRYLDLVEAFPVHSLATLERALNEETEYAGSAKPPVEDLPMVVRQSVQGGMCEIPGRSLVDDLLCGPRLAEIEQTILPTAAPRKAVRRPPPPSRSHPWRKLDKLPQAT